MSNRSWFKYCWVWNKDNSAGFALANIRPMITHEDICVFGDGKINYYPIKEQRLKSVKKTTGNASDCYGLKPIDAIYDSTFPKSVLRFSNASQINKQHPTQKPIALLQYLVQTYTNPGDRVLDNTCGSGTTLVAARDTGRNAIGIELDPKYCQIAADRCQQLTIFGAAS